MIFWKVREKSIGRTQIMFRITNFFGCASRNVGIFI